MSKWFLNWYRKQLLLSVLKNRSKNNDVGLYFSDRGFIIVKMEKKSNICFAADLPEFDREYLKMYIEDGQFIIYGGQVQIGMMRFLLKTKAKWTNIVMWKDWGDNMLKKGLCFMFGTLLLATSLSVFVFMLMIMIIFNFMKGV